MATNYPISLYDSMSDPTLSRSAGDTISISFHDDCEWCFEDPDNCFNGQLPQAGHHDHGEGPYNNLSPVRNGTVSYNAVRSRGSCECGGGTTTTAGHTITVNN